MILRLASTAMEGWDEWCGALALTGVDPRAWDLNMMLNALEATLQRNAEDEKKWAATRRQLYDPPPEEKERAAQASRKEPQARSAPRGRGLTAGAASALLAAVAAQDGGAR